VAIDVLSRGIGGMVVTLEAPSALSVGLCLAHLVTDKRAWLERLGVQEAVWPVSGKPLEIYVDNAAEFKSEALRRGCDQHGIRIAWRPPGQPHFGGIVERVIGTMMQMVHELPGTTFSNPQQRKGYDSDRTAVLTVRELERWLALDLSHLHQVARRVALLPAEERLRHVRADRWIGYTRATDAIARLETLFSWPDKQRMPNPAADRADEQPQVHDRGEVPADAPAGVAPGPPGDPLRRPAGEPLRAVHPAAVAARRRGVLVAGQLRHLVSVALPLGDRHLADDAVPADPQRGHDR
jgi:hypothetical protein